MNTEFIGSHDRQFRSIFSGFPLIIVAVIVTAAALALFLNNRCASMFRSAILLYPNAELAEEEATFLGLHRVIYTTPDSPAQVEEWYRQQWVASMRQAVTSGDFRSTQAQNWIIAAEGDQTLITFATTCP